MEDVSSEISINDNNMIKESKTNDSELKKGINDKAEENQENNDKMIKEEEDKKIVQQKQRNDRIEELYQRLKRELANEESQEKEEEENEQENGQIGEEIKNIMKAYCEAVEKEKEGIRKWYNYASRFRNEERRRISKDQKKSKQTIRQQMYEEIFDQWKIPKDKQKAVKTQTT